MSNTDFLCLFRPLNYPGGMAFAMAGLYVSDAMEDKLDPAKRQVHETATPVTHPTTTEPRK